MKRVMVRESRAEVCDTNWTTGGSERDGARMVKQTITWGTR
jgi:hypothetical protein